MLYKKEDCEILTFDVAKMKCRLHGCFLHKNSKVLPTPLEATVQQSCTEPRAGLKANVSFAFSTCKNDALAIFRRQRSVKMVAERREDEE